MSRRGKEIIHSTVIGFVVGLALGLALSVIEINSLPVCREITKPISK